MEWNKLYTITTKKTLISHSQKPRETKEKPRENQFHTAFHTTKKPWENEAWETISRGNFTRIFSREFSREFHKAFPADLHVNFPTDFSKIV